MAREDKLGEGLIHVAQQGQVRQVRREYLHPAPWQPRRHFDRAPLLALARSVRSEGVRQNLIVRPHPQHVGQYEIVAGERRWRAADPDLHSTLQLTADEAATLLGIPPGTLPCLILDLSDEDARRLSAIENLQRENLDAVDEAVYRLFLVQDVLGLQHTPMLDVSALAQEVGRRLHAVRNTPEAFEKERVALLGLFHALGTMSWESYATNQLPLLQLPEELLTPVREGRIAGRSALLIHRQTSQDLRQALREKALAGASFQELTRMVDEAQGKAWRALAADVRRRLGVRGLDRLSPERRERVVQILQELDRELDPQRTD